MSEPLTMSAEREAVIRSYIPEGYGMVEQLCAELDAERAAHKRTQEQTQKRFDDSMIAHRWFEKHFGEIMNGRDFAVKCPMADEQLRHSREVSTALLAACKEQQIRLTDLFDRYVRSSYSRNTGADSDLDLILATGRAAIALAERDSKESA